MQTNLLDLFLSKYTEINNIERDSLFYSYFKQAENNLIKNLTEEQLKFFKDFKYYFEEHLHELYYAYMNRLLTFGISSGMELQQNSNDEEDL